MRRFLLAFSFLAFFLPSHQVQAQSSGLVVQTCGTLPLAYRPGASGVFTLDINGNNCIAGSFSQTGGTISNGTDGQATTSTNQGSVAYNYGFNGATWDRLQVDASKFLKVNCATGCAGGSASNATSGVATSSTNGQTVAWLYGFNGATWDQLSSLTVGSKHAVTTAIVDAAGNQITSFGATGSTSNASSAVATSATNVPTVGYGYGFNGTTWDQLQVDGSKSLKINCITGCGGAGTVSNATSAVATSSTNLGTVAYGYGFNGTTWDQLQVDASKFLKVASRITGNTGAILDFAGQNAASPANSVLTGCQFNTAPTTITTGNASPCQLDSAGNLLVNIKAGASSGAVAQGSTTSGQTGGLTQAAVTTSAPTYTTGTTNPLSMDTTGSLRVNITSPAFNANGQTTMSASSPQTIASDQRISTANTSVAISVNTATTTQLVAISGSTKVYVTAWDVIAGGTGNITLVYGTGASCGTGTTALTGAYNLTAQAGIAKGDGSAAVLVTPSGQALCVTTSAAVQMSGSLTFQQF